MRAMVNTAARDIFHNLIEAVTAKEGWLQTGSTLLSEPHRSEQTDQLLAGVARSVVEYTSISTDVIMRQPDPRPETENGSHYKFGIIRPAGPDTSQEIKYVIIKENVKSYAQVKEILNSAFGTEHSLLKRDAREAVPRDEDNGQHGHEKRTPFSCPPYVLMDIE